MLLLLWPSGWWLVMVLAYIEVIKLSFIVIGCMWCVLSYSSPAFSLNENIPPNNCNLITVWLLFATALEWAENLGSEIEYRSTPVRIVLVNHVTRAEFNMELSSLFLFLLLARISSPPPTLYSLLCNYMTIVRLMYYFMKDNSPPQ